MAQVIDPQYGVEHSQSLRKHYQVIGQALLNFEKLSSFYPYKISRFKMFFQAELAFVNTEVLEVYLDDLLDLQVKENSIYIKSPLRLYFVGLLNLAGFLGALAIGLYSAASGASMLFSFSVAVLIASPFAVLWHVCPLDKLSRRMRFAKVISQEIARRRGTDVTGDRLSTGLFAGLIGTSSAQVHGVSRKILH